ncbi:hypothetical protein [Herbaspirillum sp.]|uniref:hypothetical protein n=1 Tax=Herbaspirillum sp. TaxID=1890675 RepID=UPI0031E468FC
MTAALLNVFASRAAVFAAPLGILFAVVSARTPAARFFAVAARPFAFFVEGFTPAACRMSAAAGAAVVEFPGGAQQALRRDAPEESGMSRFKKVIPCGAFDE